MMLDITSPRLWYFVFNICNKKKRGRQVNFCVPNFSDHIWCSILIVIYLQTPTIDSLAAQGLKLENYYVQPVCSPTRGTFLTGRYTVNYISILLYQISRN